MKVTTFINTPGGGCDYYRAELPTEIARENGVIELDSVLTQCVPSDMQFDAKHFSQYMNADIYLTQRVTHLGFVKLIREFITKSNPKTKLIMDFDDNIFSVSPLSNHYRDYGTQDVKITFTDGSEHWAWKDGQNLNIEENLKRLEEARESIKLADVVTTTTEPLADVLRQFNPNVKVLPNCVDLSIWKSLPLPEMDEVRLFWSGGYSHFDDLLLIRDPLIKILDKYPKVKLVILGWMPKGFENVFPRGRVEFHPWVKINAYPYKIATLNLNIGIIPLKDSEFNRCKSAIKWIELAALGIPSVSSFVTPYAEMATLHESDNGAFIEDNDAAAWIKGISTLIEDIQLRKTMGLNARKTVEDNFDMNTQFKRWVSVYQEALACPNPQPLLLQA